MNNTITARLIAAALLSTCCAAALADPAPWYRWRSKLDGKVVCAQIMSPQGWQKDSPPYQDSRCEKRVPGK
jgi:hypothetical protein